MLMVVKVSSRFRKVFLFIAVAVVIAIALRRRLWRRRSCRPRTLEICLDKRSRTAEGISREHRGQGHTRA